jgi:demethylmenaquinone methyltransferase/2-methoxy-6-polyprenyl-1,4-benzoquinol methylase
MSSPTSNPPNDGHERRAEQVQAMFGSIAHRYDLLNSLMSLSMHHRWRAALIRGLRLRPGMRVLDVCAGTGDVAFAAGRSEPGLGPVVGCDFCVDMLTIAAAKEAAEPRSVTWVAADALALPFKSAQFDACAVAFGIRNVVRPADGFAEMARVTRPGGVVGCLEFGTPRGRIAAALVRVYENTALPALGGLLSRRSAYAYLPESIGRFSSREDVMEMMRAAGLVDVRVMDLALGAVNLFTGVRR